MEDEIGFSGLMPQWRYGQCNLDIPKNDYLTLPCHGQGKTKVEREKDRVYNAHSFYGKCQRVREVVDSGGGAIH